MRKIIPLLLILFSILACSKSDDPFHGYKLKDPDGVILSDSPFFRLDAEVSETGMYGVRNNRLWIGLFDTNTRESLFEWTDSEVIPDFIEGDVDFVGLVKTEVNSCSVTWGITNSDKTYQIYGLLYYKRSDKQSDKTPENGGHSPSDYNSATQQLLLIHGKNSMKVSGTNSGSHVRMWDWYDGSMLVRMGGPYFLCAGSELKFQCANTMEPEKCIPVSYEECISIPQSERFFEISRFNIRSGETIWTSERLGGFIPSEALWEVFVIQQPEQWIYRFEITHISGEKETRDVVIDIETGEILSQ